MLVFCLLGVSTKTKSSGEGASEVNELAVLQKWVSSLTCISHSRDAKGWLAWGDHHIQTSVMWLLLPVKEQTRNRTRYSHCKNAAYAISRLKLQCMLRPRGPLLLNNSNFGNVWLGLRSLNTNVSFVPRDTLHSFTDGQFAILEPIHGPASPVIVKTTLHLTP